MKKAKEKIKVLLDGQGGDEVFGGYFGFDIYLQSLLKDHNIKKILKELGGYKIFLNKSGLHSFAGWIFPNLYNKLVRSHLSSRFQILNKNVLEEVKKTGINFDIKPPKKLRNYLNNLSYHFISSMTIPTLLHYEDRSSMAHSIESRVPFLDYRLVEFGVNLEPDNLVYKRTTRPLFRRALKNMLPEEIYNRKDKLGYPTPFKKWTKTILKPRINDILFNDNSNIKEFLDIEVLRKTLDLHYSDKLDFSWEIWRILSLEKFLKLFKSKVFIK
jgi:asparagine synthase (glutamine-hydrolysing)